MKNIINKILYIPLFCLLWHSAARATQFGNTTKLTHQDVIRIAIEKNPTITAYKEQLEGVKGDIVQAGLIPNPELSIDVENFGGAGDLSGFKGSETTFTVDQLIELGGKRRARLDVAQKGFEIALLSYEIAKLDVATMAEKAFWRSYVLDKKVKLTKELLRLAKATLETVKARVDAGKVSEIEEIKAKVFLSTSEILHREAVHQELAAKKALATALGSENFLDDYYLLEDDSPIKPPAPLDELLYKVKNGIRVQQVKIKEELAKKRLRLARSYSIPDIRFGLGIRHFEETNDKAFIASISIPIPIFNRNQGEKLKSLNEISQRKYELMAKELDLTQQLFELYHKLKNTYEKLDSLEREAIPNAKKGFEATKEGYSYGKFRYLDVLDAQRTLYELELQYLDALLGYWLTLSDIKSLTGELVLK